MQIQHKVKQNSVFATTPPQVLYFIVQHENTVLLLICWVCVGQLQGGLLAHSADSVSTP